MTGRTVVDEKRISFDTWVGVWEEVAPYRNGGVRISFADGLFKQTPRHNVSLRINSGNFKGNTALIPVVTDATSTALEVRVWKIADGTANEADESDDITVSIQAMQSHI